MALSDNLISAWELDEASGNAIDAHSTNDLTETGGTIGTGTGLIYGTARDFEATDTEYFEIASNASLETGDIDFTVEVWVNAETLSGDLTIASKDNRSDPIEWNVKSEPTASQKFRLYVTGFNAVIANTFGAPSTGTWYQVIAWHDSVNNQLGIAVNATTADTTSYSGGVTGGASPFRIGSLGNNSEYWDGLIGPVRFWKRVLTSDERTELYNGGAGRTYAYITAAGGASPPEVPYRLRGGGIAEIAWPAWGQSFRF